MAALFQMSPTTARGKRILSLTKVGFLKLVLERKMVTSTETQSSVAISRALQLLQTFQLSRFGRETREFRTHLTVSRFNLEISRFPTINYSLNQIRPKINSM